MNALRDTWYEIRSKTLRPIHLRRLHFASFSVFLAIFGRVIFIGTSSDGYSLFGQLVDIYGIICCIMLFIGWFALKRIWTYRGFWLAAGYWAMLLAIDIANAFDRPQMAAASIGTSLAMLNLCFGSWLLMSRDIKITYEDPNA